jgi:cyclopropane-fatty-acyl-phospholipid synthase
MKSNGIGLLHAIASVGNPVTHDAFIQKYIFPNSTNILLSKIAEELEKRYIRIYDVENISSHYYYTLKHWLVNSHKYFDKNKNKYSKEFIRMWEYYLQCCMAMSHWGPASLYQIVFYMNPKQQAPLNRM